MNQWMARWIGVIWGINKLGQKRLYFNNTPKFSIERLIISYIYSDFHILLCIRITWRVLTRLLAHPQMIRMLCRDSVWAMEIRLISVSSESRYSKLCHIYGIS